MKHRLPRTENAPVLAGVKATPFGWPAASLDPTPGVGPKQRAEPRCTNPAKPGLYAASGLPVRPRVRAGGC